MNPYWQGFRCSLCGRQFPPHATEYVCPVDGGNLVAVYDYEQMARELDPRWIVHCADRSIWRYAALLPHDGSAYSRPNTPLSNLGWSPLYRAYQLEERTGAYRVWLKDDTRLPSSSFKDRASAVVIAKALASNKQVICVASTGNAASALATLCAGTHLQAVIFVPQNTPEAKLASIAIHGARVFIVDGSYNDAVALARACCDEFGWYNRNTGFNPLTREGKKTASFEIAEQLARYEEKANSVSTVLFRAPNVMIVPVGDGNIISGLYKGFQELHALGWVTHVPRFVAATASRAPSLYRAWQRGSEVFETIPSTTIASGISVDRPCDGVMALRAVQESNGAVVEVEDEEMLDAVRVLAECTGVFVEPACAATVVALEKGISSGLIRSDDEVVLQLTGSGLKDVRSALQAAPRPQVVSTVAEVASAMKLR